MISDRTFNQRSPRSSSSLLQLLWAALAVAVLFYAPLAFAQGALPQGTEAAPEAPTMGGLLSRMLPMFLLVYGIFYIMVILPQRSKLKAQQSLIAGLKRGDQVMTSSGMVGKVASVEKEFVLLEIAPNVKVKFDPSFITKSVERPADKSAAA